MFSLGSDPDFLLGSDPDFLGGSNGRAVSGARSAGGNRCWQRILTWALPRRRYGTSRTCTRQDRRDRRHAPRSAEILVGETTASRGAYATCADVQDLYLEEVDSAPATHEEHQR